MENPYIGRIVVLISPLLLALSVVIVNAIKTWFGVDIDGSQLTALLTASVVAVGGLLYKWLDNRGKYEADVRANKKT